MGGKHGNVFPTNIVRILRKYGTSVSCTTATTRYYYFT